MDYGGRDIGPKFQKYLVYRCEIYDTSCTLWLWDFVFKFTIIQRESIGEGRR
jgi:hypothetical protein